MLPFTMRDEALRIRREISLERCNYGCEHTADALARGKTVDCGIVRHFLIETRSLPASLAATLAASPSMSLLPVAPFFLHPSNFSSARTPRIRWLMISTVLIPKHQTPDTEHAPS
jgi:hypothetical protein